MRKTIYTVLILLMLGASVGCLADQTLTITLDPPKTEAKSDLRLNHETLGATRNSTQKQYAAYTSTTKASAAKEVPIGRVGVITASKAEIRRTPSGRASRLYTCPKGTYLAITSECGQWYGVLMADASTGWVEKSRVSLLDYQVTSSIGSAGKSVGNGVVQTALKYLGIPYRWGGYSWSGLDCSGFVKAVFASHGVSLPRVSRDQSQVGAPVTWSQLQAGDRLYFACKGGGVDHVGIYMGNGLFIHSSVRNRGVAVDNITQPFYLKSLVAARRS